MTATAAPVDHAAPFMDALRADPSMAAGLGGPEATRLEQLVDQLAEQAGLEGEVEDGVAPPDHPRPAELGLTASALRDTYGRARMIRRRYTVLDLAFEAGLLGQLVDELFEPGGFWTS